MAFKDYMIKYPTLGTLVNGYTGDRLSPEYRTKIGDMFIHSVSVTLIVVALIALFGEATDTLRLLALCVFTGTYCTESVIYFCTDEGRPVIDGRFEQGREDEVPAWTRGMGYPMFLTVVIASIAGIMLIPAFFWGSFGLLVSTFLIAGSPAVIWWRFCRKSKV